MSATLLLVEDNELNRDMLSRRLKRAGFATLLATDGAEALRLMHSEQPDLVLLDMNLPVIDGWSVCSQARASAAIADIPILALTAHALAGDRARALDSGCDDYATKPVDFPRLLEQIQRLLHP